MPRVPSAVFEAVNHSKGQGCPTVRMTVTWKGCLNTACVYTVGRPWALSLFMLWGCYGQTLSVHVFLAGQVFIH